MSQKNLPAILLLSTVIIGGVGISLLQSAQNQSNLSVASVSTSVTSFSSETLADSVGSLASVSTTTSSQSISSNSSHSSMYKDGQYTNLVTYSVPHGATGAIKVQLTLANDIISAVSIQQTANERDSEEYQSSFAARYQSYVIGKKIQTLSLSRIGGATLTTDGFQQAIANIQSSAS